MQSQWMDLSEAAGVLGVTEAAVRRRIGKGRLQSRRGEGERLQVRLAMEGEAAALFEAAHRLRDEGLRDRARALALEAATRVARPGPGETQGGEVEAEASVVTTGHQAPDEQDEPADEATQRASNPWLMTAHRPSTREETVLDRRRSRIAPSLLLGRAEADATRGGRDGADAVPAAGGGVPGAGAEPERRRRKPRRGRGP